MGLKRERPFSPVHRAHSEAIVVQFIFRGLDEIYPPSGKEKGFSY
jgi:hypothetical protein